MSDGEFISHIPLACHGQQFHKHKSKTKQGRQNALPLLKKGTTAIRKDTLDIIKGVGQVQVS